MSITLTIALSPSSATTEAADHEKTPEFYDALAAALHNDGVTPEERLDEIDQEISDLTDELANADTAQEKKEILSELADLVGEHQDLEDLQALADAADEAAAQAYDGSSSCGCPLAA